MLWGKFQEEETMRHLKMLLIVYLSVWTVILGLAPLSGYAMLLPSTDNSMQRQSDLNSIQAQLETKVVSERLNAVGLTPQEVQARMQGLSDEQIHTLAQNVEGLQIGGLADWVIIAIIAGGVLLFLLLLSAITGGHHDTGHHAAVDTGHHTPVDTHGHY
jgi:hypothetical protein